MKDNDLNQENHDFNLDAIVKQMNEDHRILCKASNPDVYIYTIRTRDDGRIEANAECQSCMKSGISIFKDRKEFHTKRGVR